MEAEKLTNKIKTIALNSGADFVGFVSAQKLEEGAPKGHRPSNHLSGAKSVIVLACGRWLTEDREYYYQRGRARPILRIRTLGKPKRPNNR